MTSGTAFARAGLLGNPADGYFERIIACSVRNFSARVTLEPSERLVFEPGDADCDVFGGLGEFLGQVELYGYYGGLRLVKAALHNFLAYVRGRNLRIPERNFTLRYASDIPRQVGLAGSSAIITAALRAFMSFYGVEIPLDVQPSLILGAERDELDINAGFMDRVVQAYEGCMYMDLDERLIRETGKGRYERLDPALLPPLYLAYKLSLGKVSGRVLNEIRVKYDRGDPFTRATLHQLGDLAERGRRALLAGDKHRFSALMDENFELRRSIQTISAGNLELIEAARACGAPAKFAGSGGSIIGSYDGEEMFGRVRTALEALGAVVVKPIICY